MPGLQAPQKNRLFLSLSAMSLISLEDWTSATRVVTAGQSKQTPAQQTKARAKSPSQAPTSSLWKAWAGAA